MTTFVLSEPWMRFELTTLVVIDTDCTDSCKSNYHMIMTTPRWHINVVITIITLIEILPHTLTILWYQEDESILNKNIKKLLQCQSLYLLVRYEHDVQDVINILWTAYSCLEISTAFSPPDLIIILLFQVTSFKESFFLLKYKSTVSHSPIKWAYYMLLALESQICVVIVLQKEFNSNRTMT